MRGGKRSLLGATAPACAAEGGEPKTVMPPPGPAGAGPTAPTGSSFLSVRTVLIYDFSECSILAPVRSLAREVRGAIDAETSAPPASVDPTAVGPVSRELTLGSHQRRTCRTLNCTKRIRPLPRAEHSQISVDSPVRTRPSGVRGRPLAAFRCPPDPARLKSMNVGFAPISASVPSVGHRIPEQPSYSRTSSMLFSPLSM